MRFHRPSTWFMRRRLLLVLIAGAFMLGVGVTAGTAAQSTSTAADGLLDRLAVLRRPQVPADVLPAGLHVKFQQGTIISRLTRLILVEPQARFFLVVSSPVGGNPALWSPALGDQVAVIADTTGGASESQLVPAVDLSDADQVGEVGAATGAYRVAVVPDGVAQVRWTLANIDGKVLRRLDVAVMNNVAVAPLLQEGSVSGAGWYTADGTRIHTSGRALRRAIAVRDQILTRRLLQADSRHVLPVAPSLLDDFAAFSVRSRTGVQTSTGLTISRPRPSQVPLGILQIATSRLLVGGRLEPDLDQIRAVRARSGLEFWIIPGSRSFCVAVLDQRFLPIETGGSETSQSCSHDLASAEIDGEGESSGGPGGSSVTYGVLPKAHPTTTIRTGPHTHRIIRPPDGVYITRYVPHR